MNENPSAWAFAVARIGSVLALGVLLGLALGSVYAGLALGLAAALAWNLVNLFRLDQWLRDRSRRDPPDAGGVWGEVISQVVRLHRRKRYHKQRLLDVFRELRHSTAAMPDGVILLNEQDEILWFNRMAGQLLGLRRKADLGIRLGNLVREPEFSAYLRQQAFEQPLVLVRGAGERALSFQVVPYSSSQRMVLVRDVTHQVRLESMRKDFVANASHELRSPLTVITGYVETLCQDESLDPALRHPLEEMRRQADRMNVIVRDLLELSRLDAVNEEAAGAIIDVAALATVLRKDALARPRHPEVTLELSTDARLRGEDAEIHSAFANLVDNAVKYTPPDRSVRIRWSVEPGTGDGLFAVTDTGPGIAPEHLPRLTERFYRVDAGRARSAGGSGLGLAIVKHVLEHHGGRLEIQSAEGAGSTFTCRFPARRVVHASGAIANMD